MSTHNICFQRECKALLMTIPKLFSERNKKNISTLPKKNKHLNWSCRDSLINFSIFTFIYLHISLDIVVIIIVINVVVVADTVVVDLL